MANNFLEMSRSLRLYCPSLDIFLAQQFIRDAYRQICDRRPWSGLRAENQILFQNQKTTGTVTVVNNSTTVTGSGTTFASTDVGRQFKAGVGSPIYTITAVDVGLQTLTTDLAIGIASASGLSFTIFDGYVTMPTDFKKLIVAVDPQTGYKLRHWVTQDQLLRWDPQRNFFGLPYALVDRRYNSSGVVQYEAWPYSTSQRVVSYFYTKQAADLVNDTDTPIWPIRSDVIVSRALADLCRWPGVADQPNLMASGPNAEYNRRSYLAEFEDKMVDLERQDEEIYMTWLSDTDWYGWPWAPLSANFLQSHAV